MMGFRIFLATAFMLIVFISFGQTGRVTGKIYDGNGLPLKSVSVVIPALKMGTKSNNLGRFTLEKIPYGTWGVEVKHMGFNVHRDSIRIDRVTVARDIRLDGSFFLLDEIVVTGTKTFKRKTESPVIVNILDSKTLDNLQVCNLFMN